MISPVKKHVTAKTNQKGIGFTLKPDEVDAYRAWAERNRLTPRQAFLIGIRMFDAATEDERQAMVVGQKAWFAEFVKTETERGSGRIASPARHQSKALEPRLPTGSRSINKNVNMT